MDRREFSWVISVSHPVSFFICTVLVHCYMQVSCSGAVPKCHFYTCPLIWFVFDTMTALCYCQGWLLASARNHLPVVAFTFSRAECDSNARNLGNLDLTMSKEKSTIHSFFEDCIKSLKEPDRQIAQILMMQEILKRGIGVHHTGVLLIIEEMVDILFQSGLVKLLFATETFAMDINMPARTVIFDSITKHDGKETRNLLPAEHLQIFGRTGRRGSDKEGTVIILCKGKIPSSLEIKDMMIGKPKQLKCQFRLTYGMILSLLRVERLSMVGMMSRSFRESDHVRRMDTIREDHKKVEQSLERECNRELSGYLQPLITFFDRADECLESRKQKLVNIVF